MRSERKLKICGQVYTWRKWEREAHEAVAQHNVLGEHSLNTKCCAMALSFRSSCLQHRFFITLCFF